MALDAPTPRQIEVLSLIADGQQNKHIALKLGISENTVEKHISSLYRRLQVHTRVEASAMFRYYQATGIWQQPSGQMPKSD